MATIAFAELSPNQQGLGPQDHPEEDWAPGLVPFATSAIAYPDVPVRQQNEASVKGPEQTYWESKWRSGYHLKLIAGIGGTVALGLCALAYFLFSAASEQPIPQT